MSDRPTGTAMSERDCYLGAIEGLAHTRDCLRGLALLRSDLRWLTAVQIIDKLTDSVKVAMHRRGSAMLMLPHRTGRG